MFHLGHSMSNHQGEQTIRSKFLQIWHKGSLSWDKVIPKVSFDSSQYNPSYDHLNMATLCLIKYLRLHNNLTSQLQIGINCSALIYLQKFICILFKQCRLKSNWFNVILIDLSWYIMQ